MNSPPFGPGFTSPPNGLADRYCEVYAFGGTQGVERDIYFGFSDSEPIPSELLELRNRIDATLATLKMIYAGRKQRPKLDEAFDKLVSLATLGMGGSNPKYREAGAALDSLQSEITNREAGRIKNGYMIELGKWALGFGSFAALAYFSFTAHESWPPVELHRYRYVFLVLTGCMAGAWASFAGRKVVLSFFDLAVIEQDRIDPALRLIFTAVLTIFLVLVFSTGFADVTIGGFAAKNATSSGATAVLFGALCGLSEQALPAAIMARAKSFLDAAQGK